MISIVIPNFNGSRFLPDLFSNLKTIISADFEIIFVDNGSADNSLTIVKKLFPGAIIIRNQSNLGFGAAVNQGILAAKGTYVCLLNNDVILDQNWFKIILSVIKKHPEVSCFCGTVLNKEGTSTESQGIKFDWSGKCLQIKQQPAGLIWGSSAAVVIYKREVIKKIGLFDEKYFAYLEDIDVAFRLHQLHYQTLLVPQAIAYHLGGGTADKMGNFRAKQTFKNWFYFIFKNYTFGQIVANLPAIFIERLRNFSYLLKSTIR
jgi:GT2 family glycosyltransferase